MLLNLKEYSSESLLTSYEFILSQHLGGKLSPLDMFSQIPTAYILGHNAMEIRANYLSRNNNTKVINAIDDKVSQQISDFTGIDIKTVMTHIYEIRENAMIFM